MGYHGRAGFSHKFARDLCVVAEEIESEGVMFSRHSVSGYFPVVPPARNPGHNYVAVRLLGWNIWTEMVPFFDEHT
jgi:hypothetical protein